MTDEDFTKLMQITTVPEDEITKEFGISKSTVKRWKEGKSMPHPAVRQHVVDFFIKYTTNK